MSEENRRKFRSLKEQDDLKTHEPEIYQALQNIKEHCQLVKIVQWAEKNGILFMNDPDLESIGFSDSWRRVSVNLDKIKEKGISLEYILLHEMMHSSQQNIDHKKNRKYFGLLGSITAILACEAGAESFAMLAYHDMEQSGFDHKGRFFEGDSELFKGRYLFKRRYEQEFTRAIQNGSAHREAAFSASNQVFKAYMNDCTEMRWLYGLNALKNYMEDIVSGRITAKDTMTYPGQNYLRTFAQLGRDEFLTDLPVLPTRFEDIFGHNTRLCQVARYVEACRELRGVRATNMKRAFVTQELRDDGNPFLGVHLGEALSIWKQQPDLPAKERRGIVKIMLDLAGYDEGSQLHFNFLAKDDNSQDKDSVPASLEKEERQQTAAAVKLSLG